ncbi:MAG: hypothetical protein MJ133_10350 [Lachnospiraceae bacterium]|nr:hypothetical protein [Lachnospiraceae bacterium]
MLHLEFVKKSGDIYVYYYMKRKGDEEFGIIEVTSDLTVTIVKKLPDVIGWLIPHAVKEIKRQIADNNPMTTTVAWY